VYRVCLYIRRENISERVPAAVRGPPVDKHCLRRRTNIKANQHNGELPHSNPKAEWVWPVHEFLKEDYEEPNLLRCWCLVTVELQHPEGTQFESRLQPLIIIEP
jgi:hypothetical protein